MPIACSSRHCLLALLALGTVTSVSSESAVAETARWIVSNGKWGYITFLNAGAPAGEVLSFSDGTATQSTGRLFFYIMGGGPDSYDASLTISQAALNVSATSTSCEAVKLDPEDPRCAKITFSGKMETAKGVCTELESGSLAPPPPAASAIRC